MRTLALFLIFALCCAVSTIVAQAPGQVPPSAVAAQAADRNAAGRAAETNLGAIARYEAEKNNPGISNPLEKSAKRGDTQPKAVSKKKQGELKQNTDKLIQLTTELKLYLDNTNENLTSENVSKRTAEIEKLAKSLHKNSLGK
jgi:hypothetical protein